MSAFDKIIGYETIKNELLQIVDMIKNQDIYKKAGAKLPKDFFLMAIQGLGKILMVKCFIEECNIPTYIIRHKTANGEFIEDIKKTLEEAKTNTPSIIFLMLCNYPFKQFNGIT